MSMLDVSPATHHCCSTTRDGTGPALQHAPAATQACRHMRRCDGKAIRIVDHQMRLQPRDSGIIFGIVSVNKKCVVCDLLSCLSRQSPCRPTVRSVCMRSGYLAIQCCSLTLFQFQSSAPYFRFFEILCAAACNMWFPSLCNSSLYRHRKPPISAKNTDVT
jgi:hypothetical protein